MLLRKISLFCGCATVRFKLQRLQNQSTLNCALRHKSRIVLRTEPVAHVPLTLVRVSTGLLQADSGATRAECFFILTSSDRRSSSRIDYIPKADCFRTALDGSCASSNVTPDLCSPLPLNTLRYSLHAPRGTVTVLQFISSALYRFAPEF